MIKIEKPTLKGISLTLQLLLLILSLSNVCGAKEKSINALRSAYLYYFSQLIQWPNGTIFKDNKLKLCAITTDEQDIFQLSTIDKKRVGNYELEILLFNIKKVRERKAIFSCHIFYIRERINEFNEPKIPSHTLFITEGENITSGDIHLFTKEKKLKFDINNQELISKNFRVSSKLLRLSREFSK